jgi:hypothetical protein
MGDLLFVLWSSIGQIALSSISGRIGLLSSNALMQNRALGRWFFVFFAFFCSHSRHPR